VAVVRLDHCAAMSINANPSFRIASANRLFKLRIRAEGPSAVALADYANPGMIAGNPNEDASNANAERRSDRAP
jgi:hypothetical protein